MANELLTTRELALWTQNDPDVVAADDFALEVLDKVSEMARFLGAHPLWTLTPATANTVPFDVRMVVLQVAKRCYSNPDQVVSENIGPIGERRLDAAAMLLDLTDAERTTLTKYNPEGDPDAERNELWVLTTTRGTTPDLVEPVLFVSDDQQVGMTEDESAYPSWDIPMFSPGDPGDPNNYPDEG
jgi:hypothetical protein